jgi:hypothetical protein
MAVSDFAELIELPSGDALFFIDDDHPSEQMRHSYWRANWKKVKGVEGWHSGTRLTGVTSVTKTLDYDPSKLLNWAAKTQCIGIAQLVGPMIAEGLDLGEFTWLLDHESIWRELEAAGLTFDDVRDQAATKGTNVHRAALQALAMGAAVPDYESLTDDERRLTQGVVAFWLDHEPEPEQVEQIVYSPSLGVAGRLDFRGQLARCDDDACSCQEIEGIGVLDLKTGNYISAASHAQVGGGYPLLAEDSGFGKSDWALILKVTVDGEYELVPVHGTPAGFAGAVATYREAGRIDREAGKDRTKRAKQREAVAA